MKTMYLISIFLILIGLGCDDNSKKENDGNDLIGIWELIRIEEQDENNNWTQIKTPEGSYGPYWSCIMNLEFKDDNSFDGNTCTDGFLGSYDVYKSDGRINIKNTEGTEYYQGTRTGHKEWTLKYWDYLAKSKSYSILSDTLTISGNKFRIIFKSSLEICGCNNPAKELDWLKKRIDGYDFLFGENGASAMAFYPDTFTYSFLYKGETVIFISNADYYYNGEIKSFGVYNCTGELICGVIDGKSENCPNFLNKVKKIN